MERKFCVAPMMDRTDRHERYFLRTLSQEMLLYTEMLHANAVLHGNREELLKYNAIEHPLAIQLGGSDPGLLKEASSVAESKGFDEINLNVGCPSPRVQSGQFGAILMKNAPLVAQCIKAIKNTVSIPVTVKCRIGVDEMDEKKDLDSFVGCVKESGCNTFIVHARKAWLKGLSPKDNREIPPLNYERVYRLKDTFPDLEFILNGGINNITDSLGHLKYVDGVMLGRSAYDNPYGLIEVDELIYNKPKKLESRSQVLEGFLPYLKIENDRGSKLGHMTKHLMGLFKGTVYAKKARTLLAGIDSHERPIESIQSLIKEIKIAC